MTQKDQLQPKKRGRKPIGKQAMTPAEGKRRSRALLAENGYVEFVVRARGETLNFIDSFASKNGETRVYVVEQFLDMAISIVRGTLVRADQMLAEGATMEEIQQFMRAAFTATKPNTSKKTKTNVIKSEVTQLK